MMKVTCTLPHVTESINGIDFVRQDDQSVVAIGLSKDEASQFDGIPGYTVEDDGKPPKAPNKATKESAEAPAA